MRPIATALLLFASAFAWSAESALENKEDSFQPINDRFLSGHNLTPTSYTLRKGEVALGYYVVGVGITDQWTLATSPWMDVVYNMPMVDSKYSWNGGSVFQQMAVEGMYFHSLPFFWNWIDQKSIFLRLTGSHRFVSYYTAHLSVGAQYFFVRNRTYSLHLEKTDSTLSLSSLHEFHVWGPFGFFFELGMLGLNYGNPRIHMGLSLFARWSWGLIQVGESSSQQSARNEYGKRYSTYHPEVQLQVDL